MAKQIVLKIKKNGMIEGEINGVKGAACLDYIDLIKEITDGEIVDQEKTPEFYQHIISEEDTNLENKH